MPDEVLRSLALFGPEIACSVGLMLVVLIDAGGASWRNPAVRILTVASMAAALLLALRLPVGAHGQTIFSGMLVVDPLGLFFKVILLAASLLTVLLFTFRNSRELHGLGQGEFHSLLLAVTLSNLLLAASNDLVMIYLSLEMVSITSYVMVGYMKGDWMSTEASLKYLLFGSASTGGMLYGLSLLYGMTGATSLPQVQEFLAAGLSDQNRFAAYLVVFLIAAGFGFKVAAVPFHFWCPDVYEGAPTPVTAFLSVAPQAAALSAVRDSAGLPRRSPLLAVGMGIFLLSLVGIPPFVGFMGKLYVFAAVIERGPEYRWYAVVGALNAAIAAFYYFRVMKTIVIDAGNENKPVLNLALADRAWIVLLAAANLLPLLFWSRIEGWAHQSLVLYAGR